MTQHDQILAALKSGRIISPLDALRDFGCFRLAARVADLRAEGWDIRSHRVKTTTGKTIAVYALPNEVAA